MKPCLIVTGNAAEFADQIRASTDPSIPLRTCTSADEARRLYAGEEILLGNPGMIAGILEGMPGVRWIQSTWAGVTPLIEHGRRNYQLTGVKGIFGPQMSEYVLGYLLAHELKIPQRARAQQNREWFAWHSRMLAGKRLGIMGTGSIGSHIATTARAFDMTVTGLSRSGRAADGFDNVFPVDRIEEFLPQCDHLVATLPQTADTDRLLDAPALSLLPETAVFINVGRSNVVDDVALIEALQAGRLAGAVLDVFDEEPVPVDSPLWDAPNLSITGHIAAVSHPSLIAPIFIDNYRRYAAGKPLCYLVDFAAGY
jgi:phosphoglycerate dehydrogenase-like enzyme